MGSKQELSSTTATIWLQRLFVAVFLFLIASPSIQERFKLFTYAPVVENRNKQPRPSGLANIFISSSGYAHAYEAYFNDSYGLRDFLIKLKNQFDYSMFNVSDEVLIGRDGWLFYRKLYQHTMRAQEIESVKLPTLMTRLLRLNQFLASKGITLIMVPCPAKTTLYPEHVPTQYPAYPKDTAFQRYRAALAQHPELLTVDVQNILDQLKPRMRVFHKTDFHWTDPAGAVVWKSLYTLMVSAARLPMPPLDRVKIKKVHNLAGGEINSLAVFYPPLESSIELDAPLTRPTGTMQLTKDPNQWTYIASDTKGIPLLPPTVLIGDSFSDAFLRAGFAAAFTTLHKVPNRDFAKTLLSIPEGTRFIVVEHIESFLLSLLLEQTWSPILLSELDRYSTGQHIETKTVPEVL
ncbi:MAG: hypothetical protein RIS36_1275 [Pseudomonadota bacterium]|jgi:hypothetical protein